MILPQSPDDEESADDTPGPDPCAVFDDYWEELRREAGPDARQRLIDRNPIGESMAGDLDVLDLLHQLRKVSLADVDGSQISTTWFSESFAIKSRTRPRGSGSGASATGMEGQVTFDHPGQIGKYPVLALLDSGGQAQVYRVFHPTFAKEFALKLSRRTMATKDHTGCDQMLQEGRLLSDCDHPNLVRVIDLDVHEGRWFVVMEYVSGLTLAQFVEQRRPKPRQAALIMIELAQAVAYLHARGITHQDIKPQNVLVDDGDRPRLIDFGLARLKHAWRDGSDDAIGGTRAYMSPEQAMGHTDQIGPRTDVFGLGSVLYYLLTHRPLYLGSTPDSAQRFARKADHVPVRELNHWVPRRLERICEKALAADPEQRYQTVDEMGRALKRSLERRRIAAAGLIGLVAFTASVLFVQRLSPPIAPKIVEFAVYPYRGDPLEQLPRIGSYTGPIYQGDRILVKAKLDIDAYWYLIILRPDGNVQLYLPRNESDVPGQSDRIDPERVVIPLTDGTGLQSFVLVVSPKPLPSFQEWKGRDGIRRHWTNVASADAHGTWEYKDGDLNPISSTSRGDPEKLPDSRPAQFLKICKYLEKLPGVALIRAMAFAVEPRKRPDER